MQGKQDLLRGCFCKEVPRKDYKAGQLSISPNPDSLSYQSFVSFRPCSSLLYGIMELQPSGNCLSRLLSKSKNVVMASHDRSTVLVIQLERILSLPLDPVSFDCE